jgi:hypothetical protein
MTVLLETRFAPGGCALHRLTEAGREAGEPLPFAWLGRRRVENTFHALRERIYDY